MSRSTTMSIRLDGALSDYVSDKIGEEGSYESAGEYIRDLISREKERYEAQTIDRLKAELTLAFAAPEEMYNSLTAAEVIARNRK